MKLTEAVGTILFNDDNLSGVIAVKGLLDGQPWGWKADFVRTDTTDRATLYAVRDALPALAAAIISYVTHDPILPKETIQ